MEDLPGNHEPPFARTQVGDIMCSHGDIQTCQSLDGDAEEEEWRARLSPSEMISIQEASPLLQNRTPNKSRLIRTGSGRACITGETSV